MFHNTLIAVGCLLVYLCPFTMIQARNETALVFVVVEPNRAAVRNAQVTVTLCERKTIDAGWAV